MISLSRQLQAPRPSGLAPGRRRPCARHRRRRRTARIDTGSQPRLPGLSRAYTGPASGETAVRFYLRHDKIKGFLFEPGIGRSRPRSACGAQVMPSAARTDSVRASCWFVAAQLARRRIASLVGEPGSGLNSESANPTYVQSSPCHSRVADFRRLSAVEPEMWSRSPRIGTRSPPSAWLTMSAVISPDAPIGARRARSSGCA